MTRNLAYVCLIFCCLFGIVISAQLVESIGLPLMIGTGLRLGFLAVLLYAYYMLWRMHKLSVPKRGLRILCIAFFCYLFIIICRGDWNLSPMDLAANFVNPDGFLIYLLPIIILPLPSAKNERTIFRVLFYLSLLVLPLWLLNYDRLLIAGDKYSYQSESIGMWLPFVSAFLLPMRGVLSRRERLVNLAVFIIYFILMLINARRNICLSFALFSIISCISVVGRFSRKHYFSTKLIYSVLVCLVIMVAVCAKPLLNGPFSFLKERGLENSRSSVEAIFIADMISSPISDWVFGRGMDGTYEQLVIDNSTGDVREDRRNIETGYLNMLLKGGIVYILFVLIFLVISTIIFFKQRTPSSNYFAAVLLVYVIDMYTSSPITLFYPRSILFWLLVSIALKPATPVEVVKRLPSK